MYYIMYRDRIPKNVPIYSIVSPEKFVNYIYCLHIYYEGKLILFIKINTFLFQWIKSSWEKKSMKVWYWFFDFIPICMYLQKIW